MDDHLMASDGPESVFRSVADTEVSLDEMLSLACRQGKQDIVELLLESGAKVNYRNKAGNTPLLEACSQGHVPIARLLLDRKADIDAPTETTSDSALTWACTLGNEEVVQLLLEHKACIEHRTRDGCTALMFAALAGHEKVAKLLLDHGAKLNVESDSNKDSPLTFACWKGHQKVVELFLYHKANIEHRTKEGFSPLMFAALGGHTEVARLLLEKRAEVNNPSGSNNDIPLTSACWKGHHAVVELLLRYNSNIEHHTKDGCTPLMLAAREGHLSVAQLLLNHSAKVNVPSGSENNIPLTLACWKGHRDVVELLLRYNSNIEHQNKAGCTPLMLAAREGHYEATELLLLHQAHLNVPSGSNDDTPLTLACWKGHEGVVSLLLDKQSSINHQTKTGCTPLMEATREGHVSVAKMLLEAGADVETPDNYGQTPFFMACWKGHAEVASLLLEYGANKDCRTKTGITPFFQACRENHVEVVKLLLDYGCNPSSPFPNSRECPLTLAAEKGYSELTQVLISRNANIECRTKKGCTPFFLACKEGFTDIAVTLVKHGADTEAADQRSVTPLLAAFRNGHIEVVEWLLGHVAHLPSDLDCQKALMAPKSTDKDVLPSRSKCLELIMKAKKAREQAALKNAQILFEELDAEKEKKESKRKAAARKRTKRKEKKKKEQAEKNPENEREDGKDDDEDDYEEEEPVAEPHLPIEPPRTVENCEVQELPSSCPTRKKSKRSKKKPVPATENFLSTPTSTSSFTTAATRTSLQTPAHLIADSWEEESGDEMFVDAPSEFLPDNISLHSQGSGKEYEGSDSLPTSIKLNRESKIADSEKQKKHVKPASNSNNKNQKQKANNTSNDLAKPSVNTNSRRGTNSKGGKSTPEVPVDVPPKSPNEKKKKTGTKSPESSLIDKRGNDWRESPLLNREEEEECWDNELEPTSDWSNEQQKQPFISKQVTRAKSWSAVATVAVVTTAVSTATNTPSITSSSKNWQEVSRAIKTHQLTVSNSLVGRIIGRKGMKINQIQAESGAQISISRAIPRSIDRLVTIKGTERSVNTARELIEEALSTSSRDSEECTPVTTSSNQTNSQTVAVSTTATVSSVPLVTNVWHQSNAWGQQSVTKTKRYSDVVPPTSSCLEHNAVTNATAPSRRTSLPVNIASTDVVMVTTSVAPPTSVGSLEFATDGDIAPVTTSSYILSRNGSVPITTSTVLASLDEADEIEIQKHKRSHSEPSTTPLSKNQENDSASSLANDATPILHYTSRYSPTMPPIFSPSDNESKTISSTCSDPVLYPSSTTSDNETPSTTVMSKSSSIVGVTRVTRMVGVVAPTQAVKPYQHEFATTATVATTTQPPSIVTSSDNETSGRGNFGAIGPPNRRSSLPVTVANHFDSSVRKFSYAGIPVAHTMGGSLSVVHETLAVPLREYSWPPVNNGPPLHHHPHTPHSHVPLPPTYAPPHNHVDWGSSNSLSEAYDRGRNQNWPLPPPPPPPGSSNFGFSHDFSSNRPYHLEPDISHNSNPWGKFQTPVHQIPQPRPSHSYRPLYINSHPPYIRGTSSNHYESGNFQRDTTSNWVPPPSGYKPPPISKPDSNLPMSLRQVLGEKLEQEIFPGDNNTASVDFPSKDDSPSLSKRWSISSFPPQITTVSNGTTTWGTNNNNTYPSARHSVTVSPFQQQGDTTISDLAASWPIWTSPVTTQPQSPFSPSSAPSVSSGGDTGWSLSIDGTSSELVELMKRLDIAEHIPVLKTRKLSLEQLCAMTEDQWRDLNLPVGPRVKLMNAISNNKSLDKLLSAGTSKPVISTTSSSEKFTNSFEKSHELSLTPPTSYVK